MSHHWYDAPIAAPDAAVRAAACDRTLEALEQVDRNANLTFLIESWLADLAKIA